jgi:hypothetical protein
MRSTRLTVTTLSLLTLCALDLAAQAGGPRYALVIGNGHYAFKFCPWLRLCYREERY